MVMRIEAYINDTLYTVLMMTTLLNANNDGGVVDGMCY